MDIIYVGTGSDDFFEDVFCFFSDVFVFVETELPFVHFFVEVLADVKPVLVFADVEIMEFADDLVKCVAEDCWLLARLDAAEKDALALDSFFEFVLTAGSCSKEDGPGDFFCRRVPDQSAGW